MESDVGKDLLMGRYLRMLGDELIGFDFGKKKFSECYDVNDKVEPLCIYPEKEDDRDSDVIEFTIPNTGKKLLLDLRRGREGIEIQKGSVGVCDGMGDIPSAISGFEIRFISKTIYRRPLNSVIKIDLKPALWSKFERKSQSSGGGGGAKSRAKVVKDNLKPELDVNGVSDMDSMSMEDENEGFMEMDKLREEIKEQAEEISIKETEREVSDYIESQGTVRIKEFDYCYKIDGFNRKTDEFDGYYKVGVNYIFQLNTPYKPIKDVCGGKILCRSKSDHDKQMVLAVIR
jgi:hypothetical protein